MAIETSIVIPHYNNLARLRRTLSSVGAQISGSVEVIVVDNRSPDQSEVQALVESEGGVFLTENQFPSSPYSARNRGMERAQGSVVIMLDASCVPDEGWLKSGLAFLEQSGAGICSGNIQYEVDLETASAAELWDAVTGVNAQRAVERSHYAPGGNLFIRKQVLDDFGLFEEGLRSGGDYLLTNGAFQKGLGLVYCSDAVVLYPPKGLRDALHKAERVGRGQVGVWVQSGRFAQYLVKFPFKLLILPPLGLIRSRIGEMGRGRTVDHFTLLKICVVDWLVRVKQVQGNFSGLIRLAKF